MKKFSPRRGGSNAGIFVAGFMMFPAMGIIALSQIGLHSEMTIPAILSILFGIAVISYILIRNSASGFVYSIGEENINLKRGKIERSILIRDIAAAGSLDGRELEMFMSKLARPIAEAKMQMNVSKWWKHSRVYGDIIKWVSVVITESETRAGGPLSITKYTLNITGPVVAIKLRNKELLIITPVKTDEFISCLKDHGIPDFEKNEFINSIKTPNPGTTPEENVSSGRRRRRLYITVGIVIAVAVLSWFFLFGPGVKNETSVVAEKPVKQELETTGMWDDDMTFYFMMREDHPEALNSTIIDIGQQAPQIIISLAAICMKENYLENNPDSASIPDAKEIEHMLQFEAATRLVERMENKYGVVIHIYRISGDNLKKSFNELVLSAADQS